MSDSVQPHRWQPTRLPHPWDSPGQNTGVGCHFLLQCMKVKSESEVTQSCPTLHIPVNCSLPGSSTHGIFQARVLEWVAIAFSYNEGERNVFIRIPLGKNSITRKNYFLMFWMRLSKTSWINKWWSLKLHAWERKDILFCFNGEESTKSGREKKKTVVVEVWPQHTITSLSLPNIQDQSYGHLLEADLLCKLNKGLNFIYMLVQGVRM